MKSVYARKLTFIVLILLSFCSLRKEIRVKEIEVEHILNLDELSPKVDLSNTLFSRNIFSVDENGNLFILDQANHRVLNYDEMGTFLNQIGSIGQGEKDLYNPFAIYIKGESLYILNNAGKELKIFSLKGKFISGFKIEKVWLSDSLCIERGLVFIGARYLDKESYNDYPLITVFAEDGKKIGEVGRIVECASQIGYLHFNAVFISIRKNRIFGAFKNRPIVFCYGLDGREIFYKDLGNIGISEILDLNEIEKSENLDTPETRKSAPSMRYINYCSGFGVDKKMNLYYAINVPAGSGRGQNRHLVFQFNKEGNLKSRIFLKSGGEIIIPEVTHVDSRDTRYGIGRLGNKTILYKF